jgi:hypothetical protein
MEGLCLWRVQTSWTRRNRLYRSCNFAATPPSVSLPHLYVHFGRRPRRRSSNSTSSRTSWSPHSWGMGSVRLEACLLGIRKTHERHADVEAGIPYWKACKRRLAGGRGTPLLGSRPHELACWTLGWSALIGCFGPRGIAFERKCRSAQGLTSGARLPSWNNSRSDCCLALPSSSWACSGQGLSSPFFPLIFGPF